ncbi:hypothetical protein D3C72_1869030 [compost metagenome]
MYRLGPGAAAGFHDPVDHQVGIDGGGGTDGDGFVCRSDVQRMPIGFRIDRHGLDTHAAGSPDDPTGNFAAVSNQDLGEHG